MGGTIREKSSDLSHEFSVTALWALARIVLGTESKICLI